MRIFTTLMLGVFILASCSSIKVTSDLDKTVDFNEYKTMEYWGWAKNSDQVLNRFEKERIEAAFGEEFKKRGLELVEKGQGDMIVSLFIVTEDKVQKTANTSHMGGGGYYGYADYYDYGPGWGWGGGHSTTTYNEYEYTVGTLAVSAYDAKKQQLIWEAAGQGTVDDDPQSQEKGIPKAVAKIMEAYPVQPVNQ